MLTKVAAALIAVTMFIGTCPCAECRAGEQRTGTADQG